MSLDRIHVYEVTERVDRPGPGREYRARVVETGGPVAPGVEVRLLVLDEAECGGADVLPELVQAHGLARTVRARRVAAPLDFGMTSSGGGRCFWCASPAVLGRRLDDLLEGVGVLPDPLTEALANSLAEAVNAVHVAGLNTIGIDPERVVVQDDGTAVVIDPGLGPMLLRRARRVEATERERACFAPELFAADSHATARSDLYSIGALLYRCVAGEWFREPSAPHPTEAPSRRPNDVRHEASIFLSELVHDLLEPDLDCRIGSGAELTLILRDRRDSEWWRSRHIEQETHDEDDDEQRVVVRDPDPPPIPPPAPPPASEWFEERRAHGSGPSAHRAPCVGREAELALLVQRVRSLRESGGHVVLIEGEAGAGKTRLLDELIERGRQIPSVAVLHGEHRPRGIGRPMQAFGEALTRWICGDRRDVTVDDVLPLLGDATAVAPAFAAFLGSSAHAAGNGRMTREALAGAFMSSLRTLGRRVPVVFVVEDLQWADPEGLDLFGHLARSCEAMPLLLIGSHRPSSDRSPLSALVASLATLRRYRAMPLGPLGTDAAHAVARVLVEPEAAADAVLSALPEALRGRPGAVEAAAALAAARGTLRAPETGPYVAAQGFAAGQFPASLDGLIDARLALLGDEARMCLATASVQGLVFDADVARRAQGLSDADGRAAYEDLAARGLLRGEHPVWRFVDNSLFGRVHDTMGAEALRAGHESTADAFLASRNPDQLPPSEIHGILSYRVAWHYLLAGRDARGLLYVSAALGHLRDTWRIGDAERLADLACRALAESSGRRTEYVDFMIERADLLGVQGRRVEQREILDEALRRARDLGDAARIARAILESARLHLVTGKMTRARDEARESLKVAGDAGEVRLEARSLRLLGTVAFRDGRYQEARTHMQRVLDLSRRLADAETEAEALQTLGTISQDVGSLDHAEELQRLAMGIYRRAGDLGHEADVLAGLGAIAAATDDAVKAEQYLRRALAIHRSLGDGYGEARVLGQLGLLLQDTLRLAEARAVHVAACAASREVGARQDELAALANLATTELLLGSVDDARDHYGDALRQAREIADHRLEGYALTGLGDVARVRGELTIAAGLLERALQTLDKSGDVAGLGSALVAAGRIALLSGDTDEAEQLLERAVESSRAARTSSVTGLALALLALASARAGDADTSTARIAAAHEEVGDHDAAAPVRLELLFLDSLAARVRRDGRLADRRMLAAEEVLRELAERLPPDARALFLAQSTPAREIVAGAAAVRAAAHAG